MSKEYVVSKPNWYGFDHDAVNKRFDGDLTFVNDICVNGEYYPVAVYRAANPNVEKGHKKYMLLQTTNEGGGLVRGMSEEEMEKWRYQDAVHCLKCNQVIYSINRHDFRSCRCESISIDGGRDYTKLACDNTSRYVLGTLDLLTDEFILP